MNYRDYEMVARAVGTVELHGMITRQTTNAVLFHDGIMEEWIPKSQIIQQETMENNMVEIIVPEWLAIKKGFF